MATPTLIATPGASNANSYCTVAEATAYFESRLYRTTWEEAEVADQTVSLIWATRILDELYDWLGEKASETQALRWPRYEAEDRDGFILDSATIPTFLKNATAELAGAMLAKDRYATRDEAQGGLSSVSAGSVSVSFDRFDRIELLPETVQQILAGYHTGSGTGWETPLRRV